MTHPNLLCNGGIYYLVEGTVLTVLRETTDVSIVKNKIPAGQYTAGNVELDTFFGFIFQEFVPVESDKALRVCVGRIAFFPAKSEQLNWEDKEVFSF